MEIFGIFLVLGGDLFFALTGGLKGEDDTIPLILMVFLGLICQAIGITLFVI